MNYYMNTLILRQSENLFLLEISEKVVGMTIVVGMTRCESVAIVTKNVN